MKQKFSNAWKSSSKPGKQRKFRFNAPLHIRQKFTAAHLSKELRIKYKKRSLTVRKGDTVKIMRGKFRGSTGKVNRIELRNIKAYVDGIEKVKKDGTKVFCPLHPSRLMIITLALDDKKRLEKLERKK